MINHRMLSIELCVSVCTSVGNSKGFGFSKFPDEAAKV